MVKKILVVDDEPDKVQFLEEHLVGAGYQVVTALDGPEALQKAGAERPDLIVLDDRMPSMHGREVLRRLKDNPYTNNIPIIMAAEEPDDGELRCWQPCEDCYLTKPINPSEFLMYVQRIFDLMAGCTKFSSEHPDQAQT